MYPLFQKIKFYALILLDQETPFYVKFILVVGLIYIIYPFDLITDRIPFIGWVDDLAIGSLLVGLAVRLVPFRVKEKISAKLYGKK